MKFFRLSIIVLLSILQGGCIFPILQKSNGIRGGGNEPFDYGLDDMNTVVLYGGFIAGLTESERVNECEQLMGGEKGDVNSLSIQLRTALVMVLTPECGGPKKALLILETIRERVLAPELRSLVRYQVMLANWMIETAQQTENLQQEIKTVVSSAASLKKELQLRDDELVQLKATLNALKEIEKTFHQRNESGMQ